MDLVIGEKREETVKIAKYLALTDKGLEKQKSKFEEISKRDQILIGDNYIVAWGKGHCFKIPKLKELKNGKYKDTLKGDNLLMKDLINDIEIVPDLDDKIKVKILNNLKDITKKYKFDKIVVATDVDAEGEVIGVDILKYLKLDNHPNIWRYWNTGRNDDIKVVEKCFKEMKKSEDREKGLYNNGHSRRLIDYLFGMKLSKAISDIYRGIANYEKGEKSSGGRVQTATFGMIHNRYNEVLNFVPKSYWTYKGIYKDDAFSFFYLDDDKKPQTKIYSELQKKELDDKIEKNSKTGIVLENEKSQKIAQRRPLMSTPDFEQEFTKRTKASLKEANATLEYLRAMGFSGYPRTNGRYIKKEELDSFLESAKFALQFLGINKQVDVNKNSIVVDDSKASKQNHSPLLPLNTPSIDVQNNWKKGVKYEKEGKLIDLKHVYEGFKIICESVATHFLEDEKFEVQKIIVSIEGALFKYEGDRTLVGGWKTLTREERKNTIINFELNKGDKLTFNKISIESDLTTPPKLFTEKTLQSAMIKPASYLESELIKKGTKIDDIKTLIEKLKEVEGLGTGSTRESIIGIFSNRKQCQIGFVDKKKGINEKEAIVPTEFGFKLLSVLPEESFYIENTAKMEIDFENIRRNECDYKKIIEDFDEYIMEKMIKPMISNPKKIQGVQMARESLGIKCPICGDGEIESTGKGYSCSNRKYSKEEGVTGCKMFIFKEIKPLKTEFSDEQITELIENGEVLINGNKVILDIEGQYLTKIEFGQSSNNNNDTGGEVVDTPKFFVMDGHKIWKEYGGVKITETMAKKMFKGEEVLLKGIKSQSDPKNTYSAYFKYNFDSKKMERTRYDN